MNVRGTIGSAKHWLLVGIIGFAACLEVPAVVPATTNELISDAHFRSGFILSAPAPGAHVKYGELRGPETNCPPAWRLLQWSSRFPLSPEAVVKLKDGSLVWSNAAKTVVISGENPTNANLLLAANSGVEYGTNARTTAMPWVHLLVEQEFTNAVPLAEMKSATLKVEVHLQHVGNLHRGDYSPDRHAAQFQIFFTVQNRNRASRGYGDLLWFGIPLYDNRAAFPAEHKAQDFGGTAKFIFTPSGRTFTDRSTHEGGWVVVDKDLLPLMREGLELAWSRGFLGDSKDLADYTISGMNMGWELPGSFDVAMQVRGLGLTIVK